MSDGCITPIVLLGTIKAQSSVTRGTLEEELLLLIIGACVYGCSENCGPLQGPSFIRELRTFLGVLNMDPN